MRKVKNQTRLQPQPLLTITALIYLRKAISPSTHLKMSIFINRWKGGKKDMKAKGFHKKFTNLCTG